MSWETFALWSFLMLLLTLKLYIVAMVEYDVFIVNTYAVHVVLRELVAVVLLGILHSLCFLVLMKDSPIEILSLSLFSLVLQFPHLRFF